MKGYSTFLKASVLEPHYQMQFSVITRTPVQFNPQMRPYQVQPLWIKVDLRVMVMKGYSIYPRLQEWSLSNRCSLMPYTGDLVITVQSSVNMSSVIISRYHSHKKSNIVILTIYSKKNITRPFFHLFSILQPALIN